MPDDAELGPYASVRKDFGDYYRAYGGWPTFVTSPYTHFAAIASAACVSLWWTGSGWTQFPLQVLPNLLGFTLAAYALLLAFGDEKFRAILAGRFAKENEPIVLGKISAAFVHFIVVQVAAIAIAVLGAAHVMSATVGALKAMPCLAPYGFQLDVGQRIVAYVAFFVFALALTNALAAALAVYRVISWYIHAESGRDI